MGLHVYGLGQRSHSRRGCRAGQQEWGQGRGVSCGKEYGCKLWFAIDLRSASYFPFGFFGIHWYVRLVRLAAEGCLRRAELA